MRTMKPMEDTRDLSPMLRREVGGRTAEITVQELTVLPMDWSEKGMIINQLR